MDISIQSVAVLFILISAAGIVLYNSIDIFFSWFYFKFKQWRIPLSIIENEIKSTFNRLDTINEPLSLDDIYWNIDLGNELGVRPSKAKVWRVLRQLIDVQLVRPFIDSSGHQKNEFPGRVRFSKVP